MFAYNINEYKLFLITLKFFVISIISWAIRLFDIQLVRSIYRYTFYYVISDKFSQMTNLIIYYIILIFLLKLIFILFR